MKCFSRYAQFFGHAPPAVVSGGPPAPGRMKFMVADPPPSCWCVDLQAVTTSSPALAVIDGKLCRLSRTGSVTGAHAPLATAVMEFRQGPLRLYVREHPFGLLPGVSNVYCLDPNFGMQWLAEWPYAEDPCARLVDEVGEILVTESVAGLEVRLDAATGRVVSCQQPVAAAS